MKRLEKLVINLTPTGMVPTREMTSHVPLTVDEIVADVDRCARLGANMVHLHARDDEGQPTYRKEIYGAMIERIRAAWPDLVIGVSLSGRNFPEYEKRAEPLQLEGALRPDTGSLTLSSLNFTSTASLNSPDTVRRLAEEMGEKGIKPELEVFDVGMLNFAHYLIRKGALQPPYYFNILLGNLSNAQARASHLGLIVSELPDDSVWALAGIGDCQLAMNVLGMTLGDGARVGLEDNIYFDAGRSRLASNAELVSRVVSISELLGKPIASHREVRDALQISPASAS